MDLEPTTLRIVLIADAEERRAGEVVELPRTRALALVARGLAVPHRGERIETPEGYTAEVSVERAGVTP